MVVDFSGIIFLTIFEFLILLSSIRFFYLITKNYENKVDAESVISWISFSLILTIIITSFFSFIQNNGIVQYLTVVALFTLILHVNKKSELSVYKKYLVNTFTNIFGKILNWKTIIIISALLPVLFISMRPIDSYDSLYFLTFMLDWSFNQEIPYVRGFDYPPIWELSYIPSIILTKSDNFFWINSVKPLILIALGTYLIGREIKFPKFLIWASIFSSVLYFQFWLDTANSIGTIKNDVIVAAGIIFLIYSAVRSLRPNFDRITGIFFIVGIIFVTIKPSGILVAFIATIILVIINRKKLSANRKNIAIWTGVLLAAFSLFAGNYYLYNLVEFGNPLYPIPLNLFGLELEGSYDTTHSRIVDHLDDKRVWEVLFPYEKISRGGLLFPVLIAFGFAGTLGILIFSAVRYLKTKKFEPILVVISGFILLTWVYYFFTPFSAAERLTNIVERELFSTRYIFATLFVTELFFLYILWRLKIPNIVIFAIVGINLVSRYWILWPGISTHFDHSQIIYPLIVLIGIFVFGLCFRKFVPNMVLLGALSISVLIFSPYIIEEHRESWLGPWQKVIIYLDDLPPSEIFLVKNKPHITWTYPVIGSKFQHSIEIGSEKRLLDKLHIVDNESEESGAIENEFDVPEYIVKLCSVLAWRPGKCASTDFFEIESKLSDFGYEQVVRDNHAILWKSKLDS